MGNSGCMKCIDCWAGFKWILWMVLLRFPSSSLASCKAAGAVDTGMKSRSVNAIWGRL